MKTTTYEERGVGYAIAGCLTESDNVTRKMISELSKIFCLSNPRANPEQVARFVESLVPHTI